MTLQNALRLIHSSPAQGLKKLGVYLACGFTPLHLKTFLHAYVIETHRDRDVEMHTGLYGDLHGSLARAAEGAPNAVVVVIEWPDVHARLDLRSLGSWHPSELDHILRDARRNLSRLTEGLVLLAQRTRVIVSLPSLALPPVSYYPARYLGKFDASLRMLIYEFAEKLAAGQIYVLDEQALHEGSPLAERRDIASDLAFGFPYSRTHAAALARELAGLVPARSQMKGLITDLDDTLWKGIVGETGPDGVCWDLAGGGQIHGLYQRLLDSLVGAGVLLAVASKNDPQVVEAAFRRSDLIVKLADVFPLEVGWHPKSEGVRRILKAWNIAADAVVYVDDSPLELAEVQRAFPEIGVRQFPGNNPDKAYALIRELRDLFGRTILTAEDELRAASLRQRAGSEHDLEERPESIDEFLRQLEAVITVDAGKATSNRRPFDLVNKTNQFNLNGRRFEWADWCTHLSDPNTFQWSVRYRDKYGPLGEIAVISGHIVDGRVSVQTWVMSCRAFSRRIEHMMLRLVFETYSPSEVELDYRPTPRNGPFKDFVTIYTPDISGPTLSITRKQFEDACPRLFLSAENPSYARSA